MTALASGTSADIARATASPVSKTSVAAAVAGNVLEFYDFTTYTFFATMIGAHFFPSKDPFISLMASWRPSASASRHARSAASSLALTPIAPAASQQ